MRINVRTTIEAGERNEMSASSGLDPNGTVSFRDSYGSNMYEVWEVALVDIRDQINAIISAKGGKAVVPQRGGRSAFSK